MQTIQRFISLFADLKDIDSITDETERYEKMAEYFDSVNYFEINRTYEMMMLMIETFTSFIYDTNSEFFDIMIIVQTWLMVYQFVVLILAYKFALLRFIEYIEEDLYATKRVLSVFEAKYLYENSYILSYLKTWKDALNNNNNNKFIILSFYFNKIVKFILFLSHLCLYIRM